jgi:hypothetical protein
MRILLLSSKRISESDGKRERKAFEEMIKVLAACGIHAEHRAVRFEKDFLAAVNFAEPDVVYDALCYSDHADESFRGIQKALREKGYTRIGTGVDSPVRIGSRGELLERWRMKDISTPPSFSVHRSRDGSLDEIDATGQARDFPYSVGLDTGIECRRAGYSSIADSNVELRKKISALSRRFDGILAEKYLGQKKGARFFTVSLIGNGDRAIIMPSELRLAKGAALEFIADRDVARNRAKASSIGDRALEEEIKRFARVAFGAAGVRDFARLDVIRAEGRLYAIDVKVQPTIPDLLFDACAAIAGLDKDQSTIAIFVAGFARLFLEGSAFIAIPSAMRISLPQSVFSVLYG